MIKDILSQFRSAQSILLSLHTKRPYFVYLVTALNKALKEKNVKLKIFCKDLDIKNELQNFDPFIQEQFIENIEKTSYTIKLKQREDVVEKIGNPILDQDISLVFESKNSEISLDDFEFVKNSQNFDLAFFFGKISDQEDKLIRSIKTIKHSHHIKSSYIQFFFDLFNNIEFYSKKEIYTLLLAAILLESSNLSNNKTTKLVGLINLAIEKGGVLSIAQNYLAQNSIQDIGLLGNTLIKTKEIAKNVYYSEIFNNSFKITQNFVEDILYIIKKIKGHKLIILKVINQNRVTYHLSSAHSRVDLSLLKIKFEGSGDKEYFKFISKENSSYIIKEVLDTLLLDYPNSRVQSPNPIPVEQNPVYEANVPEAQINIDSQDPLKPASSIPEPLIFFKKQTENKPRLDSPLPSAF